MNPEIIRIIKEQSELLFSRVKAYREHIHANPELSYQEQETMRYVSNILTNLGIDHKTGAGGTGVVALIKADHHNATEPCIGLRADLDALPIKEENNIPYRSLKDGVMHACGHDVHTAILLGTSEILHHLRNELPQPVKLIFQPGEEKNPGGASLMIRDGVLIDPVVTEMYALHVFPELPVGEVGFKEGLYMASCDEIYITINGKGGHGATPHMCIDPIMVGANIVTGLQEIISRKCDPKIPSVLSIGHFEALGATNVIPSKAILKGTFRTMDEIWRAEALQLISNMVHSIVKASGATVDLEISKGYPFLKNDPALVRKMKKSATEVLGKDKVKNLPIRLTSEDFSFYSQEIPVCFYRLGVRNEAKGIVHGVHHPQFNIDDDALKIGMQLMAISPFNK